MELLDWGSQSPIKLTQYTEESYTVIGFVTLQWGFLNTVSPSVLSLNNLKIHKTKAVKNINLYTRKSIIWLIFNLGLASTRF